MRHGITRPAIAVFVGSALASGCTAAYSDATQAPKVDPKADQLLHKMSASLGSLHGFSFDAAHTLEVVTKTGQKLQFVAESEVKVQRPNMLRSDRLGAVADLTFYYDGKKMSILGHRTGFYATTPAPGTIDAAIDFARDKLSIDAPAADLLYADAYAGLMEDVISGAYIGAEPMGDRTCHHLAYHGHKTDWQLWVEDTPRALPCRFVITTLDMPSLPQFVVAFSNWNVAPELSPTVFQFTPPPGGTEVEFLALHKGDEKARQK